MDMIAAQASGAYLMVKMWQLQLMTFRYLKFKLHESHVSSVYHIE